MTADDAERYVRDGIPPFVEGYARVLDIVRGALVDQLGPAPDVSRQ